MYFVFNLNETISYGNHVMSINSQYMYDYLKDKEHDLIFVASNGIRNMKGGDQHQEAFAVSARVAESDGSTSLLRPGVRFR